MPPEGSTGHMSYEIKGKEAFRGRLLARKREGAVFELVSVMETDTSSSVFLRDQQGIMVSMSLELNEQGKITKVVGFSAG